uniref:COesterase domain-containing protein n=1 Tax=Heterorhabditis bacteriophora TaxID=37862 RepID=A0A1I7XS49_HETBA
MSPTSEDNLYLNVFTPVWSPPLTNGFPVLVFIHGGGYVGDSAVKYGDIGICRHLCSKDVVVVTLQYRLGFLGFWTTGDDVCPGNQALWDMRMGLQWIKDNITAFNGDPSNVTIMGQSAGGASVDLLSLSPKSRDLFHKVIAMAGNASCEWAVHKDAVEACRRMAANNGINSSYDSVKFLQDLRDLPAEKFATMMSLEMETGEPTCIIGPRIDGIFLPKAVCFMIKQY